MPRQPARGLPCNGVNTKMLPIAFFGLKSIFCGQPQKIVTIIMGHLKDILFVVTALQGGSQEAVQVLFGPKIWFFYASPIYYIDITHLFGVSRTRLNTIITIVLNLTVLHGIALLASAPGLYLARHLSTLYKLTHLRQTLSSWKLCYRLFFARRPKHEIDLIFRQVNFQLGKLLENFEKKMSAKHFGCNKPWGEYQRLQDSPRSLYEFNLKAFRP